MTAQEFNVDQAMANIESTGSADGPTASPTIPPSSEAQTQPPAEPELYEYQTENGKTVKETLEMLKRRAGLGYHAAQRLAEINKKEQGWTTKEQEYQQKLQSLQRWQEYNDYATQHPEWADHVHKSWEDRERVLQSQGAENPNNPLYGELQAVKKQLSDMSSFLGTLKEEKAEQQRVQEDKALGDEIASIRKKYSDIDFDLADESGKSLEYRVMEHATANGIHSFKAAFHDFYHEHLIKAREDKAKESVVKDLQSKKKAGILGTTETPTKGLHKAQNVRSKSYDELAREALAEAGLS